MTSRAACETVHIVAFDTDDDFFAEQGEYITLLFDDVDPPFKQECVVAAIDWVARQYVAVPVAASG